MFKLREIVLDENSVALSNRQLPLLFPNRASAIVHIENASSPISGNDRPLLGIAAAHLFDGPFDLIRIKLGDASRLVEINDSRL